MKKRRAVLDVNTDFLLRDVNSSSVSSSEMSNKSSNLSRESDSITDVTMVDHYSNISESGQTLSVIRGHSYTPWQICTDDNSGYTYYWNMETNQVTWEIPPEYATHEAALQQYQLPQNISTTNEIHPLIKHKIARTTQEVIANRNSHSKKPSVEGKSIQAENNDRVGLVPYGPTWEDDGKMANARKRLLSYKSDKLKPKSDELITASMYPDACSPSATSSVSSTSFSPRGEAPSCKIPFVPTPDEIKEHPIFSKFMLPPNSTSTSETQATNVLLVPQYVDTVKSSLVAEHYCSEEEDSEDNEDEHSDDIIITRLRRKALMLKELGGDVPKEIISVLDDTKTARDIIAEIEKEIPPDVNDDDSLMEMDIDTDEEAENFQSSESSVSKPVSPKLEHVGGPGNIESKVSSRSLPTTRNTRMKNIQKIKLSARARELIKTSLLTAKARATNFVETVDGLKPAEEVLGGQKKENEDATRSLLSGEETLVGKVESIPDCLELPEDRRKREEMKRLKSEIEIPRPSVVNKGAESCSTASFGLSPKSAHHDFVSTGIEFETKTNHQSLNAVFPLVDTEHRTCTSTIMADDRFTKDSLKPNQKESTCAKLESPDKKTKGDMYSFQSSFVVPIAKRVKVGGTVDDTEAMKISLVSKCDEFLQSVKNSVEIETRKKPTQIREEKHNVQAVVDDINIDEVLNSKEDEDKNVVDFSQLIMEKLKFLNDGKSSITPVQVMAIQIETLIGAWQVKALTTKYLQDWLNVSSVHLKDIEEAAAPAGWQCEWDRLVSARTRMRNPVRASCRTTKKTKKNTGISKKKTKIRSYGRYYYRNKRTGTIQWDFPETGPGTISITTVENKKRRSEEECSNRRPRTPPPPTISKTIVPPPPPVISDLETRNQKTTDHRDHASVTFDHETRSPPLSTAPPLPTSPLKPATPPPPPSPPPPPPQQLPQSFKSTATPPSPPVIAESPFPSDDSTFVTSKLRSVGSTKKSSSGLHDELNSFYSDIASLEATFSQSTDKVGKEPVTAFSNTEEYPPVSEMMRVATKVEEKVVKKKKKVKLDSALSLKKKGLEGLVAKWQKVNADI